MTIYFDSNKQAYAYKVENCTAMVSDDVWSVFCNDTSGTSWDIINGEFVDLRAEDGYKSEQALKRENEFKRKFIQTSLGWYRQIPKGYSNALQSVHSIDKMVIASNGLTPDIANVVIFYPKPDFTQSAQCTEEWLLANQYNPEPMSKEEWATFSAQFELLWAQEMYRQEVANV